MKDLEKKIDLLKAINDQLHDDPHFAYALLDSIYTIWSKHIRENNTKANAVSLALLSLSEGAKKEVMGKLDAETLELLGMNKEGYPNAKI